MLGKNDRKYRKIGWISSLTVQLIMLLIFYFLIAWKEPFPPIPTYGIEVSFGSVEQAAPNQSNIETAEETEITEYVVEETVEELINEESENTEVPVEPVQEEVLDELSEILTDEPSPDFVEEEQEVTETQEEILEEEVEMPEVTENPINSEPEQTESEAEPAKEKEDVNSDVVNSEEVADSKGNTEGSGEVGTEEGTIDDRAIMGEAGTSKGASLQLTGWSWDSPPEPKDDSNESGIIVFDISIDADGYILTVTPNRYTVSPGLMLKYKQSVERLSFSQMKGEMAAAKSVGTITFLITTK